VMEFEQGFLHSYPITDAAEVPKPGVPVITIENLPKDATFDGKTLSWRPPCGNDADFYENNVGIWPIVMTLKSSIDDENFVKRRAALIVHEFKEYPDVKCGEKQ